jgi:zinc transporter ZupT
MSAVLFSLASFVSTLAGGLLALKFNERLHYILSFTAGVLLGVVSFDVLPEIFRLTQAQGVDATGAMIALLAGFLFFHSIEKFLLVHHSREDAYVPHRHPQMGVLYALALIGHSFMDGVAIGLAFQVSDVVGIAVAIAIVTHDFCDGLNTVSLMLVHNNTTRRSFAMLALDAAAPVLGALSTFAFRVPTSFLVLFLGFFAGFLLYIAASDILPEAHSKARAATIVKLIGFTCLGAAFIYVAIRLTQ